MNREWQQILDEEKEALKHYCVVPVIEALADMLLHISPTVMEHEAMRQHNAGQAGMPQGPCQCVTCVRYRTHKETLDRARE